MPVVQTMGRRCLPVAPDAGIDDCFDISGTTLEALLHFEKADDARTSGDRSEGASRNGSITSC